MKTTYLEELLITPSKVEIPSFSEKSHVVWIRRLTQVEKDLCTASARRASRDMRKKLEDPQTEERQLLVEDEINEYDLEAMRAAWVSARLVRRALKIHRTSLENRDETHIPEPEGDDVMPVDVEQWENAVEQTEGEREEQVAAAIATAQRSLNDDVAKLSVEELKEAASPALIDTICTDIWTNEYVAQLIARGTFIDKDATKPAFKAASEVKRLLPQAMKVLSNAHMGLLVDPESVKN